MINSSEPSKIVLPFANGAGTNYIRTIPVASQIGIVNGEASFTDGFPPDTFVPAAAGGYPPDGRDMNGLLNLITAWIRWQNAGGPIVYDATFSSAVGGYPNGAVLVMANGKGLWQSTVDNNTSDPDTGGAGWQVFGLSQAASDARYAAIAGAVAQVFNVAAAGAPTNAVPLSQLQNGSIPVSFTTGAFSGAVTVPSASAGNNPVTFNQSFISAQVRNVTSSRSIGTAYTNSTGKAIFVSVMVEGLAGNTGFGGLNFYINGAQVDGFANSSASSDSATVSGVVPPGATYEVAAASTVAISLYAWNEIY